MAVDRETTPGADDEPRPGDHGPGDPSVGDKTAFRLAVYGALLLVALFAGYGLGRLNNGTASASAPIAAADDTVSGATASNGTASGGSGTGGAGDGGTGNGGATTGDSGSMPG